MADLAPMAILTSPFFIIIHWLNFSLGVSLEWIIAIFSLNLPENLSIVCGVREISGTSIIASFPCFITSSTTCKNISVFPDPVTPNNKNCPLSLLRIVLKAFSWSSFNECLSYLFVSNLISLLDSFWISSTISFSIRDLNEDKEEEVFLSRSLCLVCPWYFR